MCPALCYTLCMDFDIPVPTVPFTPFNKNVLLKPVDGEEKRASGLIVAKEAREGTPEGIVLAVAADVEGVKVGDRVVYRRWSEIMVKTEPLRLVAFEDVMGRLD